MPILRSAARSRPMLSRGGVPLLNSPGNVAAPAIVTPPSNLTFDLPTGSKRGWSGSNNQFENFFANRDWAYNFKDPNESFAGIRWQPTWMEGIGFWGRWQPAGGSIWRLYRKGSSGQALRTIVLECVTCPVTVPIGDKVVLWRNPSEGYIPGDTYFDCAGYHLPLKSKLTVTGGFGTNWGDSGSNDGTSPRRIIEIDAGQDLPFFDISPNQWKQGGYFLKSELQYRHWSFYADSATKALRYPLGDMVNLSVNSVVANDGYLMLGGVQYNPTWWDYSRDWNYIGNSLMEEMFRLECEGLAEYCGNTDPRKLAVELENEPTIIYNTGYDGSNYLIGYRDLLRDVWYPTARKAWGPERTIVVKSTQFGAWNSLNTEFDYSPPSGDNAHLVHHAYDDQVNDNGTQLNWTAIWQTDRMAQRIRQRINELGYKGGGATEVGVDHGRVGNNLTDVGQRMGRLLTSYTAQGLYMFGWNMTGDAVASSYVRNINGHNIEAYWPEISPYARRAGIMTT